MKIGLYVILLIILYICDVVSDGGNPNEGETFEEKEITSTGTTSTHMDCNGNILYEDIYRDRRIVWSTDYELIIVHCQPLPTPTQLEQWGVNISSAETINIIIDNSDIDVDYTELGPEIFKRSSPKHVRLVYSNLLGHPAPGLFEPLTELVTLEVDKAELPPMPRDSQVEKLILSTGKSGVIGGCSKLHTVLLFQWKIDQSADRWLSSCQVVNMSLSDVPPQSVHRAIRGARTLRMLLIWGCYVEHLDANVFDGMDSLEYLDLSSNRLKSITINNILPSLDTLRLRANSFEHIDKNMAVSLNKLPKLKTLDFATHWKLDLCANNSRIQDVKTSGLKSLDFGRTRTDIECFDDKKFPSLEELILDEYYRPVIKLRHLLKWPVPLHIQLHNNITTVEFTNADYATLNESKANITFTGIISLLCDCQNPYFARAVRGNLLKLSSQEVIRCEDLKNMTLVETTQDQTECTKTDCQNCECRQMWSTGGTEVECRDKIVYGIPAVTGMTKLLARNNQIKLRQEDIPDSLTYLDLTKNNISIVEKEAAEKLFSIENRQMFLSDNPIRCTCGNVHLIQLIKEHKNQVLDYNKITCGQDELLLDYIDANIKMCENESKDSELKSLLTIDPLLSDSNEILVAPLVVFGILSALTASVTILNYRCRQKLREIVCAKKWCPFYTEENDYFYDAFVSFCHEDDDFVSRILVPKLEKLGFKLCIHHRDWVPGDLIPTQIMRSIKTSRKTVIVLSKNFAHSLWGYLEFKAAHDQAIEDGMEKVILIVLDDVIETANLNKDLLSYIQINTYVKWSDPYFWDKIQIALRKRRTKQNTIGEEICIFDTPRTLITENLSKNDTDQNDTIESTITN